MSIKIEYYEMANRFIQSLMDNGWNLNSDEQVKLQDAHVNSLISEL